MQQDDDFQDLLEQFDIETYFDDEGVDYKLTSGSSGEQINVKTCPRCNGSDWKVYLNRESGLGNCFHGSCVGEPGFNKFSFVRHYTGDTPKVVVEIVKDQLKKSGWRPKTRKAIDVSVPEHITLPFSAVISKTYRCQYLEQRGFDTETIERFHLRYCSAGVYEYDDIVQNKRKFQRYDERVIIPIFDETGKMVTFQGRDVSGNAPRKYLFPPMLPGTGRYLYNLHNVLSKAHLVVGEGVFDVMALDQVLRNEPVMSGYGAVGTFGISFNTSEKSQLSQLQQVIQEGALKSITFMWDGGTKATKAAFKNAIDLASRVPLDVKVAILPDDKDPNEVSASVILDAIGNAVKANKINYMKVMAKLRQSLAVNSKSL